MEVSCQHHAWTLYLQKGKPVATEQRAG